MIVMDQLNLVVADMDATLAFYCAAGMEIPDQAVWRTDSGPHHAEIVMPGGFELAFDSVALAKVYNEGSREVSGPGSRVVLTLRMPSRAEVDQVYAELTALGHPGQQPPFDAFWGARYAIVADPDGNHVGFMSRSDPAHRSRPPDL